MKRSEMILLLDKELRGKYMDEDNFAEQILDAVLKCGMLPPALTIKNSTNATFGQVIENAPVSAKLVYKWDAE